MGAVALIAAGAATVYVATRDSEDVRRGRSSSVCRDRTETLRHSTARILGHLGVLEVDDNIFTDPWFQRTESEIALIEDDPASEIIEIRVRDYGTRFADKRWAF